MKTYKKSGLTEMEPWNEEDYPPIRMTLVSVSQADRENGSPKVGDMIAHNPKNPGDEWLVAEKYYKENYEIAHPTNDAKKDSPEMLEVKELVGHCWVHSGYLKCGFKQMTSAQKYLFDEIIGEVCKQSSEGE